MKIFSKEEVIFSINNNPFTTIDLDHRINYLIVTKNATNNKKEKELYLNDLLSVLIFDEFAKKNNFNIKKTEVQLY